MDNIKKNVNDKLNDLDGDKVDNAQKRGNDLLDKGQDKFGDKGQNDKIDKVQDKANDLVDKGQNKTGKGASGNFPS